MVLPLHGGRRERRRPTQSRCRTRARKLLPARDADALPLLPEPDPPPPTQSEPCLWITSRCDWACGQIADITPEECEDGGWYYNFVSNTCGSDGGAEPCGDLGFVAAPPEGSPEGKATPNIAPGGSGTGCACDPIERMNCYSFGGEWLETNCSCYSPVLIDVDGDGFALTDGAGGVLFDFTGDGTPELMSWTAAGSDDAWLALDGNVNGRVDDGRELFGTSTPQPAPAPGEQRNGFAALAVYDRAANGGNGDGKIDGTDAVFASLRLWRDANHDGVSQPDELHTLPVLGVVAVHLDYKESKRTDEHGNRFRYRAKVDDAKGEKVNRWAWDVFPVKPR